MKQNTVELTLSQLIEDLNNGLTWSKKEDAGYGSIQEKYSVNDINIKTIQKHPKLVGIEPSITIFKVIDDLKDKDAGTPAVKPTIDGSSKTEVPPVTKPSAPSKPVTTTSTTDVSESIDAFDGL